MFLLAGRREYVCFNNLFSSNTIICTHLFTTCQLNLMKTSDYFKTYLIVIGYWHLQIYGPLDRHIIEWGWSYPQYFYILYTFYYELQSTIVDSHISQSLEGAVTFTLSPICFFPHSYGLNGRASRVFPIWLVKISQRL